MIDKTRFAISEETRYYLNGIPLHAKDGMLRTVAAMGIASRWPTALPAGAESIPGVIVPRKTSASFVS